MTSSVRIQHALVSVYNKDGLAPIIHALHKLGVSFISTGGTQSFIEQLGYKATAVEQITDYPSIFGGRVKTLHPKIFGGILFRRHLEADLSEAKQYNIPPIDLVIVDLYPFEQTVKQGGSEDDIIEKIDIGGIALIRATAKNFAHTLIVSSVSDYSALLDLLEKKQGFSDIEDRKAFASRAFRTSSHYDAMIHAYFSGNTSPATCRPLRYGENPHQQAEFSGNLDELFEILNGKELSYNNLVDVDASLQLISEFSAPTVAIIKHTNSCGLASGETLHQAYEKAFAADPVSAFGGVIAVNHKIDLQTAETMNSLFFEILSAPDFDPKALELLKQKKNRILLKVKTVVSPMRVSKSILNGVIVQDADRLAELRSDFKIVTQRQPSEEELADLEFAIKAVKHLKSNGIALVKNRQLIGMGCGMTSRVDALQQAIKKAYEFGFDLTGAVMASDAFFPFPDCVEISQKVGITAISQPGGSIKDQDSIDMANVLGQSMVFTGVRHFRH
ncbi:MAG: bifunctional phosphoribosylaminoimidazolecarboxamide formyltransferase/IMP cyclohydrolase [Flavobacteriales bacterium]|nr:bifunctional phosphoribosylaminoimidazolecarboxamide formyltransferase/IMP cyclohydrolase [Flavobacteriales bacterium]MCZ2444629.1 bifunctional phosphoribosylaminoimidazolecarboxamide formyltransferase/IMP cyclohydrolase [Flavobacteriales bacterium]